MEIERKDAHRQGALVRQAHIYGDRGKETVIETGCFGDRTERNRDSTRTERINAQVPFIQYTGNFACISNGQSHVEL